MVPSYNNAKPDCGYILKPKCRLTALKIIGSNPVKIFYPILPYKVMFKYLDTGDKSTCLMNNRIKCQVNVKENK
jgi:hypothetical protein